MRTRPGNWNPDSWISNGQEPVCYPKLPVTGLYDKGTMKVVNGTTLILDDQGNHIDSFNISLESFRSFRGLLFHKKATGQLFRHLVKEPGSTNSAYRNVWQWFITRLYFNPMLEKNKDAKLESGIHLEFYWKSLYVPVQKLFGS